MKSNQLSELSRRQFAARIASATLGVGLVPVERLFAAGEGASTAKLSNVKAKNVICLYMAGGMSHIDTFDPKPGHEVMGATGTVASKVDGYHVGEGLQKTAQLMDRFAVVNSMNSTQGAHEQGNYYMHTSYTLRGTIRHPAMGAWMLKFNGKGNPMLPGNVVIGNGSRHPGSGFFEAKFSPLMLNNPEEGLQNSKRNESVNEAAFNRRLDIARHLDAPFHKEFKRKNVRAYRDLYDEALTLMKSEDLKAFDLSAENEATRER